MQLCGFYRVLCKSLSIRSGFKCNAQVILICEGGASELNTQSTKQIGDFLLLPKDASRCSLEFTLDFFHFFLLLDFSCEMRGMHLSLDKMQRACN